MECPSWVCRLAMNFCNGIVTFQFLHKELLSFTCNISRQPNNGRITVAMVCCRFMNLEQALIYILLSWHVVVMLIRQQITSFSHPFKKTVTSHRNTALVKQLCQCPNSNTCFRATNIVSEINLRLCFFEFLLSFFPCFVLVSPSTGRNGRVVKVWKFWVHGLL